MSTPSDTHPAVPPHRLRAALDTRSVLECLKREWGHPEVGALLSCRVDRVYPRGERGYVIAYELQFRDGAGVRGERRLGELVPGDGEAHFRHVCESLTKPRRRQLSGIPAAADVAWLRDVGIVLRRPGLDERLYGLQLLRKPNRVLPALGTTLRAVLPGRLKGELLAHRMGKRCVARFRGAGQGSDGAGSVVAKMFAKGRGRAEKAYRTLCRLREGGLGTGRAVRTPRPLAVLREWDIVLMEDVSRDPVCCLSADPREGARAAGRALEALHDCRIPVRRRHGVDEEQAIIDAWVELVSAVYPSRRTVLRQARAWCITGLHRCRSFEPAVVHRDFHEKQVALRPGAAIIMDFDTLCLSDPAIDVGNFLAHLQLARIEGRIDDAEQVMGAFREGYRPSGRDAGPSREATGFEARVDAYRRAALLRLACLHAFSEHRHQRVAELLELL